MRFGPERERGAALLTVLLLVAVIAVLAATMLERLRLSTRLAGNAAAIEQARAYAYAAETLALTRIDSILNQSPDRITLAGGWQNRPFGLPLPGGGVATARVADGGNCFNLNGLVGENEPGVYSSDPPMRTQFSRLLRLTGVPPQVAEQVAAGTADWIDTDDLVQPQGAEDAAYLRGEVPYRTSGTLMADVSELRAVAGVTPDLYRRIRPFVCALPVAQPARINVNTLLPEQAPLFSMFFPDGRLPPEAAQQYLLRRPAQGYGDPNQLLAGPASAGITPDIPPQFSAKTRWFALRVDVSLGGTTVEERALIDANALPARLVSRQWGEAS
ncbi:type II secretion system minor pseudopilin GspK [Sphingomonas lenta]|uniref:Type II secretion system protein K n=1 Tax=Sphingomonas lenta TaxID=1141887 RepID=A0A2A2SKJ9_9SPHN|nr:type II secretion system minor pseudopilin GspK [Sphingomonas lenta]PAX09680.1 type II secretory pathway protein [Sphingomonas lenta]